MGNSSEQSVLTHPYVKLESVRDADTGICRDGRGRETAAGRGIMLSDLRVLSLVQIRGIRGAIQSHGMIITYTDQKSRASG
jgi:hypothetical protein